MGFQLDILMYLQSIRNELLTGIFTFFTICTEVPVITVLTAMLYWCINKKAGQRILFALAGSSRKKHCKNAKANWNKRFDITENTNSHRILFSKWSYTNSYNFLDIYDNAI